MTKSKTLSTCKEFKTFKEWKAEHDKWHKEHPILSWIQVNILGRYYRIKAYITSIPKEIKWFVQRGRRGWADCDVWSVSDYLSKVIPEMLIKLKKDKHGVPIPEWFNEPRNLTNKEFKRAQKEWDVDLVKIIKGFEATKAVLDSPMNTARHIKTIHEGFDLFKKHYFNLWD